MVANANIAHQLYGHYNTRWGFDNVSNNTNALRSALLANAITLEVFTSYVIWQGSWLVLQVRSLLPGEATMWYHRSIYTVLPTMSANNHGTTYIYYYKDFGLKLGLTFRWRCWKEAHHVKTFTHIIYKLILWYYVDSLFKSSPFSRKVH